ncbi:hypothetical protein [Cognatishimia activa]|uniref:Uncharacterized protein n=1 Tax=Cognatishimia activa TaxID=1715691 RepID=A0A0P1IS22_9RHOB|nr:hypothetical protein [Cognatishimia activa]CUI99028.1 hypothetical protein TA5113_01969 [Cognatishimia activa]CUK26247.1 hypothetical protein TA5114_02056 [Cognatishimia activa]
MKIVGLFRIKTSFGQPDLVWVKDSGLEFEIPEDRYRAAKYLPEVTTLSWREVEET